MTLPNTDQRALECIYDRNADLLYRLALSHLQNRQDAEDAVQDVFVRYLRVGPTFTDEAHERAWFVRVTVNQCRDSLRRRKLRLYTPLEELSEQLCAQESAASDAAEVLRGLAALPEKYRAVIALHYLEGYSVGEVGQLLGLSASAVKMRLSRGREQIRKAEQEGGHVSKRAD